ncbi:MAG: recombinase family protein [Chloroflexi bacterium]|nr:recombinase family protein [Chloroflexota bacterium]
MNELHDYTPVALYARVSSDRQDVDLSVAAQLRALRDHAAKNGYSVVREYVDEAESGRIADRPQFRKMIDEGSKPEAPFKEILVWKFSRFTRKREHAVAFKAQLRRKGIRVVSITEQAEDNATGRLLEGIIESVDEYYSENLAQEVLRGMREAASRGFWVASHAPLGYNRVMVPDGPKKRPTLEVNPDTSRIVRRIFTMAEAGKGTQEITRILNQEGVASPRGKLWGKTSVHGILTNEAYTGTLVWGEGAKDKGEPIRVEKAFPAIISKAQFRRVNQFMHSRAPKLRHPRRVGSSYLLSGLIKCQACGTSLVGRYAQNGKYAYYVCLSNIKIAKDACETPSINARRFEELVVNKIRANILTEGNIRALVKVVDEEMDGLAREQRKRLETIDDELEEVKRKLARIWHFVENTDTDMAAASERIAEHRERQLRLEDAAAEARMVLTQRRKVLDDVNTIAAYAQDMSEFLEESELTERRSFIESFVKEIVVVPGDALMRYTVPMPDDSLIPGKATETVALPDSVLSTVQIGGPDWTERNWTSAVLASPRTTPSSSHSTAGSGRNA